MILGDPGREAEQFGAYFDVQNEAFLAVFLAIDGSFRTFDRLKTELNGLDLRTLLQATAVLTRA